MLTDETFPSDFENFNDAFIDQKNGDETRNSHSSENSSQDFFVNNSVSVNSIESLMIKPPLPPPRKMNDSHGTSFSSNDSSFSSNRFPPIPPRELNFISLGEVRE